MAKTRSSGLGAGGAVLGGYAGGGMAGVMSSMGSLGGSGNLPGDADDIQMMQDPTQLQANAAAAAAANNSAFADSDDADYHQLYNGRNYYQAQNMDIDQQMATIAYLSNEAEAGSLYSPSQNLNYALARGAKLNGQQKYMDDNLTAAMHNLGYNVTLSRYDHEGFINGLLAQAGYRGDYGNLTAAQLKSYLVGRSYVHNQYVSTSYNDFKRAPAGDPFRDRAVRVEYRAAANAQAMMPGRGPGGDFGEIILGKGQTYRIVDVKYSGKKARAQGTQNYTRDQVVVVVEVGNKKNNKGG